MLLTATRQGHYNVHSCKIRRRQIRPLMLQYSAVILKYGHVKLTMSQKFPIQF